MILILFLIVIICLAVTDLLEVFFTYISDKIIEYLRNKPGKSDGNENSDREKFYLNLEKVRLERKAQSRWYNSLECYKNIEIINDRLNQLEYEHTIKSIDYNEFMNDCELKMKNEFLTSYRFSCKFEHMYLIGEPNKNISIHEKAIIKFKNMDSVKNIPLNYRLLLEERFRVCESSQEEIDYWTEKFEALVKKIINTIENIESFTAEDLVKEGYSITELQEIELIKKRPY